MKDLILFGLFIAFIATVCFATQSTKFIKTDSIQTSADAIMILNKRIGEGYTRFQLVKLRDNSWLLEAIKE